MNHKPGPSLNFSDGNVSGEYIKMPGTDENSLASETPQATDSSDAEQMSAKELLGPKYYLTKNQIMKRFPSCKKSSITEIMEKCTGTAEELLVHPTCSHQFSPNRDEKARDGAPKMTLEEFILGESILGSMQNNNLDESDAQLARWYLSNKMEKRRFPIGFQRQNNSIVQKLGTQDPILWNQCDETRQEVQGIQYAPQDSIEDPSHNAQFGLNPSYADQRVSVPPITNNPFVYQSPYEGSNQYAHQATSSTAMPPHYIDSATNCNDTTAQDKIAPSILPKLSATITIEPRIPMTPEERRQREREYRKRWINSMPVEEQLKFRQKERERAKQRRDRKKRILSIPAQKATEEDIEEAHKIQMKKAEIYAKARLKREQQRRAKVIEARELERICNLSGEYTNSTETDQTSLTSVPPQTTRIERSFAEYNLQKNMEQYQSDPIDKSALILGAEGRDSIRLNPSYVDQRASVSLSTNDPCIYQSSSRVPSHHVQATSDQNAPQNYIEDPSHYAQLGSNSSFVAEGVTASPITNDPFVYQSTSEVPTLYQESANQNTEENYDYFWENYSVNQRAAEYQYLEIFPEAQAASSSDMPPHHMTEYSNQMEEQDFYQQLNFNEPVAQDTIVPNIPLTEIEATTCEKEVSRNAEKALVTERKPRTRMSAEERNQKRRERKMRRFNSLTVEEKHKLRQKELEEAKQKRIRDNKILSIPIQEATEEEIEGARNIQRKRAEYNAKAKLGRDKRRVKISTSEVPNNYAQESMEYADNYSSNPLSLSRNNLLIYQNTFKDPPNHYDQEFMEPNTGDHNWTLQPINNQEHEFFRMSLGTETHYIDSLTTKAISCNPTAQNKTVPKILSGLPESTTIGEEVASILPLATNTTENEGNKEAEKVLVNKNNSRIAMTAEQRRQRRRENAKRRFNLLPVEEQLTFRQKIREKSKQRRVREKELLSIPIQEATEEDIEKAYNIQTKRAKYVAKARLRREQRRTKEREAQEDIQKELEREKKNERKREMYSSMPKEQKDLLRKKINKRDRARRQRQKAENQSEVQSEVQSSDNSANIDKTLQFYSDGAQK